MSRALHIDRSGPLARAAVLRDGELSDLHLDRLDRPAWLGSLRLGRVVRVVAGLDAAFVEIGDRLPGLLNAADVRPLPSGRERREARIGQLLRTGQTVLVQVKADAHGDKGAVLTMDVTLPGRFLVHAPLGSGLHLSRRLGRGPERARMQATLRDLLPAEGGWIVRADAAAADPGLLALEAESLWADWRQAARAAEGAGAPALLLPAPTAPVRALLEFGGAGFDTIRVEGAESLAEVRAWCRDRAPDLEPLVRPHVARLSLFEEGDLAGAIAALAERRVPLAQGGSLVIERTEALTVIDVNGGERGNPLSTNLDAAREIARQLRLRNVGGIVVVDFVNMAAAADREHLLLTLTQAVSEDPAGTHVYGLSKLGLMEMTRARRGPPVADLLAGLD